MPQNFIRKLTGSRRSRKADIQLGLTLAFVAGAINAGGFLAVKQYTSHMTGIISSVADYLADHNLAAALHSFSYIFSFFCGAVVSTIVINWARKRSFQSEYALALMLEAALLLAFGISASQLQSHFTFQITILLLCFIMGLQNAIITKISKAEIRTTHMTGIVTDMGIDAGRFLYAIFSGDKKISGRMDQFRLRTGLLLCFFIGGFIGAISFLAIGFSATIPLAVVLAVLASVPIWDDLLAIYRI